MNLQELNREVQSLVVSAKSGDQCSIHRLWELVRPFIEGKAYKYLAKFYAETEEVPGLCYLAFEDSLQRYDPSINFTFLGFCMYMVKYHMIDYLRHRVDIERHEIPFSVAVSDLDDDSSGYEDEDIRIYQLALSFGGLHRFEDDVVRRTTVESTIHRAKMNATCLKVVEMLMKGYTPQQVQRALGIGRSSYYRIIQQLRKILAELEELV